MKNFKILEIVTIRPKKAPKNDNDRFPFLNVPRPLSLICYALHFWWTHLFLTASADFVFLRLSVPAPLTFTIHSGATLHPSPGFPWVLQVPVTPFPVRFDLFYFSDLRSGPPLSLWSTVLYHHIKAFAIGWRQISCTFYVPGIHKNACWVKR